MINLKREHGSDGDISCVLNTVANEETVPGKCAAIEGKDFVGIKERTITFKAGEVTHRIEIELPDCEIDKEAEEDEIDTVSFALVLTNPLPTGVKLSKK